MICIHQRNSPKFMMEFSSAKYHAEEGEIRCMGTKWGIGQAAIEQKSIQEHYSINAIAKESNHIIGHIYRSVAYKAQEEITPFYLGLVMSQLEYCVQLWIAYFKKVWANWKESWGK